MSMRNLVPWLGRGSVPVRREESDPLRDFQREMNRLFGEFFGDFPLAERSRESAWETSAFMPRVDVSETDLEVKVTAELPGMDEKDISVELQENVLILRGEKKSEQEEKGKNWFRREQSYGSFHRAIELPAGVDAGKASAQFKKGVLTFKAPKLEEEKEKRKAIPIETE